LATEAQHAAQSEHNLLVAGRLADADAYDWAITALFYAALHLLQAYLTRTGIHVTTHMARDRYMRAATDLLPILSDYRALRDASEHARYECRAFSGPEFLSIRDNAFLAITSHLRSLLGVT
jgi:HEPN domain-containing protein